MRRSIGPSTFSTKKRALLYQLGGGRFWIPSMIAMPHTTGLPCLLQARIPVNATLTKL
jgi:hypothetical protein